MPDNIDVTRAKREMYYRLFSTELGKEVLEDMKHRCYFYKSVFLGDGGFQNIRDAREGMRSFMIETEGWIKSVAHPPKDLPTQAVSQTAEGVSG